MKRNLYVALSVVAILVAAGLMGWWIWTARAPAGDTSQGQVLYERNCAVCHGLDGNGKGEAAYLLQPKPRNFRAGEFRLVSSQNRQPTREDIFRVIANGMPGTPMPSWAHLAESDRWEMADYILKLNWQGWVDKGMSLGDARAEAEKYATEITQPGDAIPLPSEPAVTPRGLRQGRAYYLKVCAKCHGEDGKGRFDPTWRTAEGFPTWARNLSEGVFKGGREGEQLYLRFFTGMPGTPMPSGELPGEQVWRVVQYVQSLSDPAAQEQARIRREEIVVKRLQSLPAGPEDTAWDTVPELRLALMPLWWHEGYINAVRVKAAHDGQRLAFRLEWDDATRDAEGIRQQSFPDGAAVQLTANASPPLFAMGAAGEAVNIWHWKALWDEDQKQFQDVATAFPGMVADSYYGSEKGWQSGPLEDARYRPADAARNLIASPHRTSTVEDANAAGFGSLTSQAAEKQNVEGVSRWEDGVWHLQLVRDMEASDAGDVPLRAERAASVAFAIWDGSAGDRNGQKSVSIWNTLILE